MATRSVADGSSKELSYRKRLIEIANQLNSAASIQDILVDIKDKILDLVEADRVTIFALDTKNQELFSLFKAGQEVKEIRVAKTFGSIAGFTALSRKTVNIRNAYDPSELTRLHPNLKFDSRWDKSSGFRTTQVLATPILFEKYLLGVLQLINKRGGQGFTPKDEEAAEELAKILGIAFYNQHRAARSSNKPTKYGYARRQGRRLREGHRSGGHQGPRQSGRPVSKILMEDPFKVPKEEIGKAMAQFFNCKLLGRRPRAISCPRSIKAPPDHRTSSRRTFPASRSRSARARCSSPSRIRTTSRGCDAIKAMNLSPRHEFLVALQMTTSSSVPQPRATASVPLPDRSRSVDDTADLASHHHGTRIRRRRRDGGAVRRHSAEAREPTKATTGDRQAREQDHHRGLQQGRFGYSHRALRQAGSDGRPVPHRRRLS